MSKKRTIQENQSGFYQAENLRRAAIKHYAALIFRILLIGIIIFSVFRSNWTFHSKEYTIQSPYLPNAFTGYKIAQISDLHGKEYGEKNVHLIQAIDDFQPDLLVITGDLISDNEENPERIIAELQPLAAKYSTFFIKGNHELHRDQEKKEDIEKSLKAIGVTCLHNQQIPIIRRERKIILAGLEEPYSYYQNKAEETRMPVEDFLGPKGEDFTLLLAHNPLYWKDYLRWGADLTLSGHMHGGLVRLPFAGGLISPERNAVPSFDRGLYQSQSKSLLVSGGLGNSGHSFRLFNRPELLLITLESLSIH